MEPAFGRFRSPFRWKMDLRCCQPKEISREKGPPQITFPVSGQFHEEAKKYTLKKFGYNPGELNDSMVYPIDFADSRMWFDQFLTLRFQEFGDFQDAIVSDASILHHSLLSPMMNIGLITSQYVLERTLAYHRENPIPLNSLEGFIRQIVGWREFLRGVYHFKGRYQRTKNYWGFTRKIPKSFWEGTTGILPVDLTIKKVLKTGYAHHIERLMVLGNIMLLAEFDPDEVYTWFMALFIDAYDWVMVPNVYGMSQFADGGLMATKPYISGSNYLIKMSDFPKGEWQGAWTALFWRFMDQHRDKLGKNPRLNMLIKTYDKMEKSKQHKTHELAQKILSNW